MKTIIAALVGMLACASSARAETNVAAESGDGIWSGSVGGGFRRGTQGAGFSLGDGLAPAILGSAQSHRLAIAVVNYGIMLTDVVGAERWYRGNWELQGELFGGAQYSPSVEYLAGITPLLRYNFATRARFVPFVDAGAGVSLSGIREPDLGGTLQFNSTAGVGLHWFWRDNATLTLGYRFVHLSSAGLSHPNRGVNANVFKVGMSWFFL